MEITPRSVALGSQTERQVTLIQSFELMQSHGAQIAAITRTAQALFSGAQSTHKKSNFSKRQRMWIASEVAASEHPAIYKGVNFSRIQIADVISQRDSGAPVEFETLGPYLADYMKSGGVMALANLTPEDAIGLRLSKVFRALFPDARLVSLYDDYNQATLRNPFDPARDDPQQVFTSAEKTIFRQSLIKLFKDCGAISETAVEGKEFLMIAESAKAKDAEVLVNRLDAMGCIQRDEERIVFVNEEVENPLYRKIPLRTAGGRWLCEALDAATYLKTENSEIVHIVVLPDYMKMQQDKAWEILRVLGIKPHKYHNIFFDEQLAPEHVARVVERAFRVA
jgi:hypothetical protein